jgi:hypothetical protein
MKNHEHRTKEKRIVGYDNCVGFVGDSGARRQGHTKCNEISHGGICYIHTCSCGAVKHENRNQGCYESSGWFDAE